MQCALAITLLIQCFIFIQSKFILGINFFSVSIKKIGTSKQQSLPELESHFVSFPGYRSHTITSRRKHTTIVFQYQQKKYLSLDLTHLPGSTSRPKGLPSLSPLSSSFVAPYFLLFFNPSLPSLPSSLISPLSLSFLLSSQLSGTLESADTLFFSQPRTCFSQLKRPLRCRALKSWLLRFGTKGVSGRVVGRGSWRGRLESGGREGGTGSGEGALGIQEGEGRGSGEGGREGARERTSEGARERTS